MVSRQQRVPVLNEYCLEHIINFLDIDDRLNFVKAFPDSKSLIKRVIGKEIFNFTDAYRKYPYWKVTEIFNEFGPSIKRISMWFVEVQQIVELSYLFPRNVHNFEEVYLYFPGNVDHQLLKVIIESSKKITLLYLRGNQYLNKHVFLMTVLKEIKILNLEGNSQLTGIHMDRFSKLRFLNLQGCSGIQSTHFMSILRRANLTHLNIAGCHELDDEAFGMLCKTQINLIELGVSHCYENANVNDVITLPKLRYIHIFWHTELSHRQTKLVNLLAQRRLRCIEKLIIVKPVNFTLSERLGIFKMRNLYKLSFLEDVDLSDKFLSEIALKCPKLEEVSLADSRSITKQGVVELVRNLTCLRSMNLKGCRQLGNDLYMNLLDAKMKSENLKHLKVYVYNTSLDEEYFALSESYKLVRKIVELSWFHAKNY